MSVTDLTGTKWYFNATATPESSGYYSINFVSNGSPYTQFNIEPGYIVYGGNVVYDSSLGGWYDEAYRTISITGGSHVIHNQLIDFIESNATQLFDLTVTYADAEIVSLNESRTKTLKTSGKYCTDDIIITYTKPSSGGGSGGFYVVGNNLGTNWTITPVVAESGASITVKYTGSTQPVPPMSGYGIADVNGATLVPLKTSGSITKNETFTFTMPSESCVLREITSW